MSEEVIHLHLILDICIPVCVEEWLQSHFCREHFTFYVQTYFHL